MQSQDHTNCRWEATSPSVSVFDTFCYLRCLLNYTLSGMTVNPDDADQKSKNIPAGATIDTGITHPVETDYYQYTHGGLLGTSRPGHYVVSRTEPSIFTEHELTTPQQLLYDVS